MVEAGVLHHAACMGTTKVAHQRHRLLRAHRRVHAQCINQDVIVQVLCTLQMNAGVCRKCGTAFRTKMEQLTQADHKHEECIRVRRPLHQSYRRAQVHTLHDKGAEGTAQGTLQAASCSKLLAGRYSIACHVPKPQACLQQSKERAFEV